MNTLLDLALLALGATCLVRRVRGGAPLGALEVTTVAALALGCLATWTAADLLLWTKTPRPSPRPLALLALEAAAAAAALALVWRGRARGGPVAGPARAPAPEAGARRLVVAVTAAAVIGVLAALAYLAFHSASRPEGEWDAYAIWNFRARMLLRGGGDPSVVFSADFLAHHPDYPLLLPALVATGWREAGEGATWVPVAVAGVFFAAAVAAVASGAARTRGPVAAGFAVLVLVAAPHLARTAAWQYADVPVAAFLALATAWLLVAASAPPDRARGALALAGACAALSAWTKNEGLLHVAALSVAVLAAPPPGRGRLRSAGAFFLGAAPLLLVVVAFKVAWAPPNDLVEGAGAGHGLGALLDLRRWEKVLKAFVQEPLVGSRWTFVLGAALLALLPPRRAGGVRVPGAPALGLALVAAGYAVVYVMSPHALAWHIRSSLPRLCVQAWPSIVLLVAFRWGGVAEAARTAPGEARTGVPLNAAG